MNLYFKIAGMALVVFATSAYGFCMCNDVKRHLMELREIKKMMFLLKGEINFSCTPLFEAAQNIANRCDYVVRDILEQLAAYDLEQKTMTISEIWRACFSDGLRRSKLSREEKDRLIGIGDSFGLADNESQQNSIDIYLDELNVSICELEKALPAKLKMYRGLGVMSGIVISIIII